MKLYIRGPNGELLVNNVDRVLRTAIERINSTNQIAIELRYTRADDPGFGVRFDRRYPAEYLHLNANFERVTNGG